MRIAAIVLGILGGLFAGLLGMKWVSDANGSEAKRAREMLATVKSLGADTKEADAMLSELDRMSTAGYLLVVSLVLGIAGAVSVQMGKGRIGAGLMAAAVVLPAFFAAKSLVFTFFLIGGAITAWLAGDRPAATAPGDHTAALGAK